MKLRAEASNAFFSPDLFVTCEPADRADPLVKRRAGVIIEVLSESTAGYDQGEKFDEYRRLDSLREYVLVDARCQRVIVYRRREAGLWEFEPLTADSTLRLEWLNNSVPVAALYADTDIPEKREPAGESPRDQ